MIRRTIEICPRCGQYMPWRKYSCHKVQGQKRVYVKCWRCGKREVILYFPPPQTAKANLP